MLQDFNVHPTIPASDLDRARDFYERKVGLSPDQVTPAGVVYRFSNTWFLLFPSSSAGTNQATAMGIQVRDLDAVVEELRGRGISFEEYDFPDFKTVNGIVRTPVGRSAWFKDSESNVIGLVELDQPVD